MTHGSLFSGLGGFDLAAQWMGWENVFHCEWNPFGQRILKHYWPNATSYSDITKTDFSVHRGTIDIITGGFPCQPFSTAGKRKGKEDYRHLWPQMLRAIREIQPAWVVGENVRGLTNWNGGMVFDEVQADLEVEGYEVTPFLLPACAVNAPHRRDRIWFIAYSKGNNDKRDTGTIRSPDELETEERPEEWLPESRGSGKRPVADTDSSTGTQREYRKTGREATEDKSEGNQWKRLRTVIARTGEEGITTDANGHKRPERRMHTYERETSERYTGALDTRFARGNWQDFPTQSPLCGGDDGLPRELDGITFSKWRNESLKGYGNAIVPQVAFEIFKAIELTRNEL